MENTSIPPKIHSLTFHQFSTWGLTTAIVTKPNVKIRNDQTMASSLYESLAANRRVSLGYWIAKGAEDIPKHKPLKSTLGHVESLMPSHVPSVTLSMHICLVQRAHGLGSSTGSGNTVLFAPQKHLQKKTGFAACADSYRRIEMRRQQSDGNVMEVDYGQAFTSRHELMRI
jgi:hypothetical protein